MSKVPLVLEGVGNPYEDACAEALDVVIERGALLPRRGHAVVSGVSGSALALRGGQLVAESGSTRGLSWGDVAFFLPQWRVRWGSGSVDLSALLSPQVAGAEAYYPLLLSGLNWTLTGGTVGVNRLPNGDFRQGSAGWSVIKGTVQLGWTGSGGYAAWFRGAGASTPPYPHYAGIGSQPFAIDRTKPSTLRFESLCEPYDRYTYDNLPPQVVVRVWQRDSSGRIGTEPLLVYASGEAAHATGAMGVWHRHLVLGGVIHPHDSGLSPRWDAGATHAEVEVFCNFNKQRVANLQLLEGGLASWRVEGGRRFGRWVFAPPPEPLTCEVYAPVDWDLTDIWALRFDLVRIVGAESVLDDGLQLVLDVESGERFVGRILSYRRKEIVLGGLQSVVYEGVEFDASLARGQRVRRVGLAFGVQASQSESPVVEIGSPLVDGGGSEVEGFGVFGHGGLSRGSASYYLTEAIQVGGGLWLESSPAAARVELPLHSFHGARVVGARRNAGTRLRLYRLVGGAYYLVGERASDGAIVDMGVVGEPYRAGGVLPTADMGVVWGGRVVVGQSGSSVVWVSGQGAPLSFAESGLRDEDAFTVVLAEPLRAIGAEPDAVCLYGQTRVYRLTRYAPPVVLEDYSPLPDTAQAVDWGVVVSRGRVAARGRVLRELPADFVVGGCRLGQDGSVLVWHLSQPVGYVLTEDGWSRWTLPTVVKDALMVDGYWVVVSEQGCWRLCSSAGRVAGAQWVSGWFAAEGQSRAMWVWLRGRATVRWRALGSASALSKAVQDDRWQVPTGGVARAWRLELALGAEDAVYGLAVEGEVGGTR